MAVLADDDVIMHRNAKRRGDIDDRFRHLDVRLRGRRIAGGWLCTSKLKAKSSRKNNDLSYRQK